MGVQLDARYQIEAYEAIKESISETKRAGIVLPTGTGKTYLALKLIEDNLDKTQILYVSHSPTLNVQIRKTIKEVYPKEEAKVILSKVKFVTYSGLDRRFKNDKTDMQEYNSDVIILDELHRSGAKDWGKAVDYLIENNKNAQLLGMTATPLRSDGQNMIERRFEKTAYELKISEAVARGILTLPIYISSRYIFEEDIQSLQEKINSIDDEKEKEKLQQKLDEAKKSVENAKGLKEIIKKHMKNGKWLIFCNPGDDIEKLQEQAKKEGWFNEINESQTFLTVESSRTNEENEIALRTFERKGGKDLRLLYSKNMLNEGIHDEEIVGELMLRPTKSYILFTQQLGRILSKDRPESPIVLDLVGNIRYFKEFRLEVQRIIQEGIKRGDKRYNKKTLEQFRILEEQEEFIKAFEEIETSIQQYRDKSAIEKTLDILENLQREGIDVTKIKQTIKENGKPRGTYLFEIQHENIEEIIEKLGLDRKYPIGIRLINLKQAYQGKTTYKITEEDRRRIEDLGVAEKQKSAISAIEKTLDILESLQIEGIDVTKIPKYTKENGKRRKTYLHEIQHENIEGIIEKLGLDRKYPIGMRISNLKRAYNGTLTYKITDEDRKRIEALGLTKKRKKSVIEETLDILESLQREGIDVTKIKLLINNDNNKEKRSTYLSEIQHENIEQILEKLGLDKKYPIGMRVNILRKSYKGTLPCKITDEDRRRIEALGLAERKSAIEETLDILESLQREGIDVTQIKQLIRENGKQRKTYLGEIQHENIEGIIEKLGLDRKYPIGMKLANLKQAYKGTLTCKITDEDRRRIEALGLVSELDKKLAEQNRLKEKARKTRDLKRKVKEQLEKRNENKKLGEKDE